MVQFCSTICLDALVYGFNSLLFFLAWSQQSAGVHMMDDNCGIRYDWTLATNCSGVPGQLMTLNSGFSSSAAGLLNKS
jgi:hypothetical protein